MESRVQGLNTDGESVMLYVQCDPSQIMMSEAMPSHGGPLRTSIHPGFDAKLGLIINWSRSFSYSGKYQIDDRKVEKIKSDMSSWDGVNDGPQNSYIVYDNIKITPPSMKRKSDLTLLRNLMTGSKFIIKPYEKASLTEWGPLTNKNAVPTTMDLTKHLDKNDALQFSLKGSSKHIGNVLKFCEPYISQWLKAQDRFFDNL